MEQLPGSSTARDSTQPDRVRLIRVSVQPKTWFGKLVAGIAALALLVVGFFVSLVLFAIAACIGAAAIVYFLWARRRARRAMRDRVIDGEVKSRDIR
jgi:Flp pilus assembly protein TadB